MKKRKVFVGICIGIIVSAFIGCYAMIAPSVSASAIGNQTVHGDGFSNGRHRGGFASSQSGDFAGGQTQGNSSNGSKFKQDRGQMRGNSNRSKFSQSEGQNQGNTNGSESSNGNSSMNPSSSQQDGSMGNSNNNGMPSMPNEIGSHMKNRGMSTLQKVGLASFVLIIVSTTGILIVTKFGKITIKEAFSNKKRFAISATSVVLMTFIITLATTNSVKNSTDGMRNLPNEKSQSMPRNNNGDNNGAQNNNNNGTEGNDSSDEGTQNNNNGSNQMNPNDDGNNQTNPKSSNDGNQGNTDNGSADSNSSGATQQNDSSNVVSANNL